MLSTQSLITLLLGSRLALPAEPEVEPLSIREWNALHQRMSESTVSLIELPGLGKSNLVNILELSEPEVERINRLLGRYEALSAAIERLEGLGIQTLTRYSPEYPARYRARLKEKAPLYLFCAGEIALLGQPGIAVVGSRNLDQAGQESAAFVGNACGLSGLVLYSGGARGVDTISMEAALEARGTAVGVLAYSLEKEMRPQPVRQALERGDFCLVTPYLPDAGFTVGGAMGRNRLIYCLADYAIVVASDAEKGGTWAGASQAIKASWLPVFVLQHPDMPDGNRLLIKKGGIVFPHPFPEHPAQLPVWLKAHTPDQKPKPEQPGLF